MRPEVSVPVNGLTDLRRRWMMALVVGELVGFVPPAITGATLAGMAAPDVVFVAALTTAGLLEGLAIGVAERSVLARYAPAVEGRAWVAATVAAAGFAWFVGMGGVVLMGAGMEPAWQRRCCWSRHGRPLLSMGYGQWVVLRRAVPQSSRWVAVTAGAWLLGIMIPIAALSIIPNDWPPLAFFLVGVASAVAMGLTVGAVTGGTLERLLATQPSPVRPLPVAGGSSGTRR